MGHVSHRCALAGLGVIGRKHVQRLSTTLVDAALSTNCWISARALYDFIGGS